MLTLSCSQTLRQREVAEGRDALERMAAMNEGLARDKRELNAHALQVCSCSTPCTPTHQGATLLWMCCDHIEPLNCLSSEFKDYFGL